MQKFKRSALIIDDDQEVRESIALALEAQDIITFTIRQAASVDEAFKILQKTHPDIIMLDLHMPGQSGFDFIDQLNAEKGAESSQQVIMLTADDTLENLHDATTHNIDAYHFLGKPFDIPSLHALVFKICLKLNK